MATSAETLAPSSVQDSSEHGFSRPEMHKETLPGTVHHYEKHVFLCYKDPQSWPPQIEISETDDLPRLLAAALKARKSDMPKKTRLTICEGTESLNGDVLIFPDMVQYKGLTTSDIESFVEEVLVHERDWPSGNPEVLEGSHVFVCAHGSRDMRCGVCGPALIESFKNEIADRGLDSNVFVRSCSHVGGHKYAGNVIIYSADASGEVAGHWYGYVSPNDVAILLDEHIGKGKIIDKLWRGQMGLAEADQKQAHKQRLELVGSLEDQKADCFCSQMKEQMNGHLDKNSTSNPACCQEKSRGMKGDKSAHGKSSGIWSCSFSCFDSWEKGDTLAVLAVVGAVAAVAFAFKLSRKSP